MIARIGAVMLTVLLIGASPARALTILFAGQEDTSWAGNTVPNWYNIGTGYCSLGDCRQPYGRICSTAGGDNLAVNDPPSSRIWTPNFAPQGFLWVHFWVAIINNQQFANNQQALLVRSPDGVSRILIRLSSPLGTYKLSKRDAAGVITDLGSPVTTGWSYGGGLHQVDLRIDYSAAGGLQLWLDGVLSIDYVGDPRTDLATTLNRVDFAAFQGYGSYFSEVIIADQDTRSMALLSLTPVASGNTQSWIPNTVGNINEQTLATSGSPAADSTLIGTVNANALSQWTTPSTLPPGAWFMRAVVQEVRLRKSVTGVSPQNFDWSMRLGGVDYLGGTPIPLSTNFGNYSGKVWQTRPDGAQWSPGDITGGTLQTGVTSLP